MPDTDEAGKIYTGMHKGIALIQAGRGVEGSAQILKAASSTMNCVATIAKLGGFFPPPANAVAAGISGVLSLVSIIVELHAPEEKSAADKMVQKIETVFNQLLSEERWTKAKAVLQLFEPELKGLRAQAMADFHTLNWVQVEAASKLIEGGGGALALLELETG